MNRTDSCLESNREVINSEQEIFFLRREMKSEEKKIIEYMRKPIEEQFFVAKITSHFATCPYY